APRYNDKGELVGSIGIHLDITEQKMLELELLEAREQAESSANAKQLFLANMSHEIRTPMNAILGMGRQLQKTALDETQKFYLDTISNAGEHLMVIINDILDISKIEAGKLALESISFSIREVIKNTVDVMQHRASEKGILVSCSSDEKIAAVLKGDPYRLKQILFNLVGNAVKFSEKGIVIINCILRNESDNLQLVEITVADTGIGMDKHYLDNLFQSFTQEDKSVSRKYGGTGLGMTITKQLTELMGGTINVKSKKNVGTTITLTIPFSIGNEKDLLADETIITDNSILKGKKILLVEDNEINRLVASITLNQYGADITEAINGIEAVEAVKNMPFDLVLMDMQMPLMDGLEATKIIRSEIGSAVPVIALTANAIKGESDKCYAAGMNDFISKPFEEQALIGLIAKWLNKNIEASIPVKKKEPVTALYDLSGLQVLSNGNAGFVTKIVDLFINQVQTSLSQFELAKKENNFSLIKNLVHKIKPSFETIGVVCLRDMLDNIELLAAKNEPSEELDGLLVQMDSTLRELQHALQKDFYSNEFASS
ncbi:MAG TPA: ATP-binding protein, partial [Ferruginibacter sp.]|nr:ATP-binding protein [Ferruginibacter sp.]